MKGIRASGNHIVAITVITLAAILTGASQSAQGEILRPIAVPFTDVVVSDEFWGPRLATNRKVTVPYRFRKCQETSMGDLILISSNVHMKKYEMLHDQGGGVTAAFPVHFMQDGDGNWKIYCF